MSLAFPIAWCIFRISDVSKGSPNPVFVTEDSFFSFSRQLQCRIRNRAQKYYNLVTAVTTVQLVTDSERTNGCVYKRCFRQWKMSSVMNQSLTHAFRESIRDTDVSSLVRPLKLSCVICEIMELCTSSQCVYLRVSCDPNSKHQSLYFPKQR